MSVATTEKRKSASGHSDEHTIWFRVTTWGRQAETAHEYLAKGRQVFVEGRLRLEQYTDRDGNLRISPEVNASDIHFLGQRADAADRAVENGRIEENDEEVMAKPATSRNGHRQSSKRSSTKEPVDVADSDIPF